LVIYQKVKIMNSVKVKYFVLEVNIKSGILLRNVWDAPSEFVEALKKRLIKSNPEYYLKKNTHISVRGVPKSIKLYRIVKAQATGKLMLMVERGMWSALSEEIADFNKLMEVTGSLTRIKPSISNSTVSVKASPPKFKMQLEDYQKGALADAMSKNQGILSFPPGGGKTVLACALISELKERTLVVVHTEALLHQWIRSLKDKAFGEKLSVSTIMEGKFDLSGKHVVVAIVNSLMINPTKLYEMIDSFGMVILDECHHVAAPTFLSVISKMSATRRYGLTASLKRRDKKEFLMTAVFGQTLVNMTYDNVAHRLQLPSITPVVLDLPDFPVSEMYQRRGSVKNDDYDDYLIYTRVHDWLCENETRNKRILDIVKTCLDDKENSVLILTKRREHAKYLGEKIEELFNTPCGVLLGGGSKKYKAHKEEIIKNANSGELRVVIGTSIADEGLDIARLNRLLLTIPTSFSEMVRQRIGRIARVMIGKTAPIVYDFIDVYVPELHMSWENSRKKFFQSLKLTINEQI